MPPRSEARFKLVLNALEVCLHMLAKTPNLTEEQTLNLEYALDAVQAELEELN